MSRVLEGESNLCEVFSEGSFRTGLDLIGVSDPSPMMLILIKVSIYLRCVNTCLNLSSVKVNKELEIKEGSVD